MHLEQLIELHDAQAGRAEGRRRKGTPKGEEVKRRKKEKWKRRKKKPQSGERRADNKEKQAWLRAKGGGATSAPLHPPTNCPQTRRASTQADCLRQKGGEKQARSKQRMNSPMKGEC